MHAYKFVLQMSKFFHYAGKLHQPSQPVAKLRSALVKETVFVKLACSCKLSFVFLLGFAGIVFVIITCLPSILC